MQHAEFKKASMRHLSTCNMLLESIENCKLNDVQKIIHNIYYLSGYVIETSLNYAFYSCINYKGEVENHTLYNKKALKNHYFDIKIKYIRLNGGDLSNLPLISNKHINPKLDKLYSGWSTDLRYFISSDNAAIDNNLIKQFMAEIQKFQSTILRRF